ncbi:hypothetical protein ABFT23_07110 [Nocardioides sp. C4-1]|uniref:hypothetical protein n=1 Tax=Nocardioides sp. C4-1 TaxID=3151851 RepID=UPI0032638F60
MSTTKNLGRALLLPVLPLLLLLGLVGGASAALAAVVDGPAENRAPARPVVVEVEGDAANGFTLHHADGSSISPPTDSEAMAECGEYDTRLDRVRCRVEVRTWYRDLGDLQRSLAWVRAHG